MSDGPPLSRKILYESLYLITLLLSSILDPSLQLSRLNSAATGSEETIQMVIDNCKETSSVRGHCSDCMHGYSGTSLISNSETSLNSGHVQYVVLLFAL